MPPPLKVLSIASECVPFAKTGGLGDVVGTLPKALHRRGLDVRVVMPLYAGMPWHELEILEGSLAVPMQHGVARAGVRTGDLILELDGRPIEGVADLQRLLDDRIVGRRVPLRVARDGRPLELGLTPVELRA